MQVNRYQKGFIHQPFLGKESLCKCGTQHLKRFVLCGIHLHDKRATDSTDILKKALEHISIGNINIELPKERSHKSHNLAGRTSCQE